MSKAAYVILMIESLVISMWLGLIALLSGFDGSPTHIEDYLAGLGALIGLSFAAYCIYKIASSGTTK